MPFLIVVIFVVLGPPIGSLVLAVVTLAPELGKPAVAPPMALTETVRSFGFVALVSYAVGGLQAAFAGIAAMISFGANDYRRVSLLPVLAVSALGAMASHVVLVTRTPPVNVPLAVFAVHLGAGLACALIANGAIRLLRRGPPGRSPSCAS